MDNLDQKVDKILENQNVMQKCMLSIQNNEINIISSQKEMLKTQFEMQNNINKMQQDISGMKQEIKRLDTKMDAQYEKLNNKMDEQYNKLNTKMDANIYDISEMFRDLYKHIDKDNYKASDRNLKLLKKN